MIRLLAWSSGDKEKHGGRFINPRRAGYVISQSPPAATDFLELHNTLYLVWLRKTQAGSEIGASTLGSRAAQGFFRISIPRENNMAIPRPAIPKMSRGKWSGW